MKYEEMKEYVRLTGERDMELKMTRGSDPQICGPFFDVTAGGKYLGWTSPSGRDELMNIYVAARVTKAANTFNKREAIGDLAAQIGIAVKNCRTMESYASVAANRDNIPRDLAALRGQLDSIHEVVLHMQAQEPQPQVQV